MNTKKYLVTNMSEGSICVAGRKRIDIPGKCQDLPLVLPANTAKQTISRLKQRYPLLKIREAVEANATSAAPVSTTAKPKTARAKKESAPVSNSAKNPDEIGSAEDNGENNRAEADASQTPVATQ